jgi:hypothetical protein
MVVFLLVKVLPLPLFLKDVAYKLLNFIIWQKTKGSLAFTHHQRFYNFIDFWYHQI